MIVDRRTLLLGSGAFAASSLGLAGYAVAVEPALEPAIRSYALAPASWPDALPLRIGVIADLHACKPWMSAERIAGIVRQVNAMQPDVVVVLGDFNAGHGFVSGPVWPAEWADALRALDAPLGSFAILGNHDWWHGPVPGMPGGAAEIREALSQTRITLLENTVVPVTKDGRRFWIAGLADQMAHRIQPGWTRGADDLRGTLRLVPDGEPVILLAHEPFIFPRVPSRVALTLSGHTHGGQINLPIIGAPLSPTHRYRYGHVIEGDRHLIVSGGLGESIVPARIGVPPELLCVDLGGAAKAA